jgi:hypothetical protein
MQSHRFDQGWAAGPRRKLGAVAAVTIVLGAVVGGLIGWLIETTLLPGATLAVIALAFVGAASGVLYTSWLATEDAELRDRGDEA